MKHQTAEISFTAPDGASYRFFGSIEDCESLTDAIRKLDEARAQAESEDKEDKDGARERASNAEAELQRVREDILHLRIRERFLTEELQALERKIRWAKYRWEFGSGLLTRYGMQPKESWEEAMDRGQQAYNANPLGEPGDEALNAPAPNSWKIPY